MNGTSNVTRDVTEYDRALSVIFCHIMFSLIPGKLINRDLAYTERAELIGKGLADMALNFDVQEKDELEINGFPISIAYGYIDFAACEWGGSAMLIELTDSPSMALLIVGGDEKGWSQYEAIITAIYVSMEDRSVES